MTSNRESRLAAAVETGTAIVFGGSGFIGTHLVRALAAAGTSVVIADLVEPSTLPAGVRYEPCDVRLPITVAHDRPFDVVYNVAAVHRTPGHAPHEYYAANVTGALNLIDWLQDGGERQLVFTSSIAVYRPSEELISEQTRPGPVSDYGHSKVMAEGIYGRWLRADQTRRLAITRPAVVFGPGEGSNYTRLARALRSGTFMYPGRDDVIKSGGYVSDLVRALMWATQQEDRFLLFNYCDPYRSTLAEICEAFHEVAGYRLPRRVSPALVRVGMLVLAAVNPADRGPISAARIHKLRVSTNIACQELLTRGFVWETDRVSALRRWYEDSDGRFV